MVTIGATPLVAQTMLARPIARLTRERPNIRVRIVSRPTPLIASLLHGEFDFVLTMAGDEQPLHELEIRPFYDDHLVLVARRGHPVTRIKQPTPRELQHFTWLLPLAGNSHRLRFERAFEVDGIDAPQAIVEAGTSAAILELAAQTDHVGLVPELAVVGLPRSGALSIIRLNSPLMVRSISVIWRKNQVISPAALRLMQLLEAARPSLYRPRPRSRRQ